MTMHLTRHTTTGKRRVKFKYASAEHKRQSEQLEQEWTALKKRHETPTAPAGKKPLQSSKRYHLSIPAGRGTDHIPSLSTGIGVATKQDAPVYTGDKVKGIGTMHKSNAVPIFSDEQAVEISTMRRG